MVKGSRKKRGMFNLLVLEMLVCKLSEVVGGSFAEGGEGVGGHFGGGELVSAVRL